MKIAPVVEVKAKFSAYLKSCRDEPVIVTKNGKPVAALLPIADEDELERIILAYSPRLQAILAKSREQIRQGKVLEHDEFWREVDAEYTDEPTVSVTN